MSTDYLVQHNLDIQVEDAPWYQATTLRERLHTRKNGKYLSTSGQNADLERGQWRFQHWKKQFDGQEDIFAQRLALDALTEEDVHVLFSEPAEYVRDHFSSQPAWLEQILRLFPLLPTPMPSEATSEQETSMHAARYQALLKQREVHSIAFLELVAPFISEGCQRLQAGMQTLSLQTATMPFESSAIEEYFLPQLLPRLLQAISRTMALEVNVARLQNILQGETPEARFQNFIERLQQPAFALALWQEYPVLTRLIALYVDQWVENSLTFLHRLCADWDAICKTFSPDTNPGLLKGLEGNAGDSHQGGQTVMILTFTSGLRLVYKPRSLNVYVHFQELLLWLNEHGDHPPFKILRVLSQGSYGWVEFVATQGCSSREEICRFYLRQGAYLALLYMLAATDFHYENLIAVGEDPILVDLESLFHPLVKGHGLEKDADTLAGDALFDSVMRVMFLPQRYFANGESEGVELSGLGGAPGQLSPHQGLHIEDSHKDTLRFIRKRIEMPGSHNRPQLNGEEVDVQDYVGEIIHGFRNMYAVLLEHRQELLSDNGHLARFAADEVRAILRPTYRYSRLLMESLHPDVLRNALDRDILFDHLWKEVAQHAFLARVFSSEQADLQHGDVPFFRTRADSVDVWNSVGEVFSDFFDESGLDRARKCLLKFSERDLEKQIWFIRASLTTLSIGVQNLVWPGYSLADTTLPATPARLLEEACAIGDRLEARALSGERDTNWIGLSFVDDRMWRMAPMGIDLYNGLGGVILFLAYLGKISKETRYTALARAALVTLRRQLEQFRPYINDIGGFTGWGSIIYLFSHLGALWQDHTFMIEAQELVSFLRPHIANDEAHDILGGAAGCIVTLSSLYHVAPSQEILATMQECGDLLLAHAQPMSSGVGWGNSHNSQALTGFSHGVAGIAWALLKLADLTGQERFRATALQALAYERSCFSPEARNWFDLRDSVIQNKAPGDHSYMSVWCHGSAGIALARLASLPYLHDAITHEEIAFALQTTLEKGFGQNHSLCHGDLGNIESLMLASRSYSSNYATDVARLAAGILSSIKQSGWLCGVPQGLETPGLMVGLAGIGYGLLRLAEPEQVPSVLLLEPPIIWESPGPVFSPVI